MKYNDLNEAAQRAICENTILTFVGTETVELRHKAYTKINPEVLVLPKINYFDWQQLNLFIIHNHE